MTSPAEIAQYSAFRQRMVEEQLRARSITDERVLAAMLSVPRHEFAPDRCRDHAYADHPLPIDECQTISQPFIVALMLEALTLSPADKVLEVGTGSGYVTALLAELAAEVISIERHASLADSARQRLDAMGYRNVRIVVGDGSRGFPQSAPYHAILVSAAAAELPRELLDQLAEGGRLIIPIGTAETQQLQLVRKRNRELVISPRELCRFVPLVSDNGRS